jgi:hypothetical protein
MAFLKQHRKAVLELEGRKLSGNFKVSLTNERDREALTEFLNEVRKQLRDFEPGNPKGYFPKEKKVPAKKKAKAKRKVKAKRKS